MVGGYRVYGIELVAGKMDYAALMEKWNEEDKIIFDNIVDNMMYTRDVPRKAKYHPQEVMDETLVKDLLDYILQRKIERRNAKSSSQGGESKQL